VTVETSRWRFIPPFFSEAPCCSSLKWYLNTTSTTDRCYTWGSLGNTQLLVVYLTTVRSRELALFDKL
jgi:hypothetical protein